MGQLFRQRPNLEPASSDRGTLVRVLAIDDDPVILTAIRLLLEMEGCEVVAAVGGVAGLDAFERAHDDERPFAVVFTDLTMPGFDGLRVAEAIKALSPQTPVVLLSGLIETLEGDSVGSTHIDLLMRKPPKRQELRKVLVSLLGASGGASPADASVVVAVSK